jgi:hypothetical protein
MTKRKYKHHATILLYIEDKTHKKYFVLHEEHDSALCKRLEPLYVQNASPLSFMQKRISFK